MTQTNKPFIAVHPGELVKDEIEARGVPQKKLAEILGVPYAIFLQPPDCQEKQDPHRPFYFRQASVCCNVAIMVRNFGKI